MPEVKKFRGFHGPNYTQVPDELFDELMADLSGAELKVLLYVMRRTFGFKKGSDRISKSQLENGIQRRNGDALDRGTGLSRRAIRLAVDSLVEKNILLKHRHASSENGDEATEYALNVIGRDPWVESTHGGGTKSTHGGGYPVPTQQTGSQETVFKNVNVTLNVPRKGNRTGPAISESALAKHYGLTREHIDKVRRLVDHQADVLGHRDRNHAAYVKRAAEAVRDGLTAVLESALGEVKDASHRKAIGSLPAYFTRVYDAMRAEATRPRLDFAGAQRRREASDEPTSAGDVMRTQRQRLIAAIAAQGLSLPTHLTEASITDIAAWYDQAQRTF